MRDVCLPHVELAWFVGFRNTNISKMEKQRLGFDITQLPVSSFFRVSPVRVLTTLP